MPLYNLCTVFFWGTTHVFLEDVAEILIVPDPAFPSDIGNGIPLIRQHGQGLLDAVPVQILDYGGA